MRVYGFGKLLTGPLQRGVIGRGHKSAACLYRELKWEIAVYPWSQPD